MREPEAICDACGKPIQDLNDDGILSITFEDSSIDFCPGCRRRCFGESATEIREKVQKATGASLV